MNRPFVRVHVLSRALAFTVCLGMALRPGRAETSGDDSVLSRVLPKGALFDPLLADPRWAHFTASYLNCIGNEDLGSVGAANFGVNFGLYRDEFPGAGQWQVGLQTGVFAIFDLDAVSNDLLNADYWVGVPLSYRQDRFSGVFRVFHQSSHLGDEFLLRNTVERINLSYEAIDLKGSHDMGAGFRSYAGIGCICRVEPEHVRPWSLQIGTEYRCPRVFFSDTIRPVVALDIQNRQETDWNFDFSLRAGVELTKARIFDRKLHLFLEYFSGHSPNGQFYENEVQFIGLGVHLFLD